MKYIRKHLPTGTMYEDEFAEIHHADFAQYNVISKKALKLRADSIIKQWNKEMPHTWHYELKEEEVEHG